MPEYFAPDSVIVEGATVRYTAKALATLPASIAKQLIDAEEHRYWMAQLGQTATDIAETILKGQYPKVSVHGVQGDHVYWSAQPGCRTCDGVGYLLSVHSGSERECDNCEGTGESHIAPRIFATDMEGNHLALVDLLTIQHH